MIWSMTVRSLVLSVALLVVANAEANYRELLQRGTSRKEVEELYEQYDAKVLQQTGDRTGEIEKLAGGADFKQSFILACLSNGWTVRAADIDPRYLPPSGAWAFSKEGYGGVVRQFPADCKQIDCIDIPDFGSFRIKSLMIGDQVLAQLYSEPKFSGKRHMRRGKLSKVDSPLRSLRLRTAPRIDFVTLSEYASGDSVASFHLHVSGANVDDGAVLVVDDQDNDASKLELRLDNSEWLGLGADAAGAGYNLDPTYFAFPIYHYDSISAPIRKAAIGSKVTLRVRNPDGQSSNTIEFEIPSPENLDSDGDGLLDAWERDGIHGLDLAALGADPMRKDLYIEVDRMVVPGRVWSDFSEQAYPRPEIFADVQAMFRAAPVINPDLSVGIELHVDYGQKDFEGGGHSKGGTEIPWKRYIGFDDVDETSVDVAQRDRYCNATQIHQNPEYFPENRRGVFRYCIFADQQWSSRSTGGGNESSIFFLSLGVCRMRAVDHNYQVGVFTHELGHLFGLTHTGKQKRSSYNNKPNYNSLMNYLYTFSGHDIDGKLGGTEAGVTGDQVYAYSEGMRASINEATLHEVLGVANHYPHDWNRNGKLDREPVRVMLRNPRYEIPRALTDTSDWASMKFGIEE